MKLRVKVTYEFDERPPETAEYVLEASGAHTCVARAMRLAQKDLKPRGWSSMLVCVLERLNADTPIDEPKELLGLMEDGKEV